MAAFFIQRCYKIEYDDNQSGAFTAIDGAVAFSYTLHRDVDIEDDNGDPIAPVPREGFCYGNFWVQDFAVVETLFDASKYAKNFDNLPRLKFYYYDNQGTAKVKTFQRVIFCVSARGGSDFHSELDDLESELPLSHRVPFMLALPPEALISEHITTASP